MSNRKISKKEMQNTASIKDVYTALFNCFGPQGWWPLIKNGEVVHHASFTSKELTKKEQFEISIGAILTQNTNWKNVEKALLNLDKLNAINPKVIQNININTLRKAIKPAGYYNQKAKKLKAFAGFKGKSTRTSLLSIWGIGLETADSILCYAHSCPLFVVDTYTKRIFSRFGFGELDYAQLQELVQENLNPEHYKEFHALLVNLGKHYCKKDPECEDCPVKKQCNYTKQ